MRRIWTARRSRRTIRSAAPRSTAARSASPPDRGWGCGGGPNLLRDALRRSRPSGPGSPHLHVRSAASPRGARGAGVARGGAGAAPPGGRPRPRSRRPAPDVPARPIALAPDDEPAVSAALIELGRWGGSYYGAPLGMALRAVLPGRSEEHTSELQSPM